jgi:hypothetical protein
MARGAKPDAFGPKLTFTDQIEKKRYWWFLNEAGRCELCLKAPDRDADLFCRNHPAGHDLYLARRPPHGAGD